MNTMAPALQDYLARRDAERLVDEVSQTIEPVFAGLRSQVLELTATANEELFYLLASVDDVEDRQIIDLGALEAPVPATPGFTAGQFIFGELPAGELVAV